MIARRHILLDGLLVLTFGSGIACSCPANGRQSPHTIGCMLADADFDRVYPAGTATRLYRTGNEPIIMSSGDRELDRALAETLAKCSSLLQVLPGFAFYDDYDGLNAYATSRIRLDRADGTVLMGKRLLSRLMRQPEAPDACIAAVCAHEFGHILQFKHGLIEPLRAGQMTGKRVELQADYFSGYFAGFRKRERPTYPAAVFAMTHYTFGDNMRDAPSHHGTPEERGAAVVRGFQAAYKEGLPLADAIRQSTRYALST